MSYVVLTERKAAVDPGKLLGFSGAELQSLEASPLIRLGIFPAAQVFV